MRKLLSDSLFLLLSPVWAPAMLAGFAVGFMYCSLATGFSFAGDFLVFICQSDHRRRSGNT